MNRAITLRRRSLLKGLAALPLLRARRAVAAPSLKYFVCVVQTGGYVQESWRPPVGPLGDLPSSAQPLTAFKDKLLFLPDLTDPSMGSCTNCGHEAYASLFYGLPAVSADQYPEPLGPTVDQIVAAAMPETTVRSLALGDAVDSGPQLSNARGYSRCFWSAAGQPIVPDRNPAQTVARLFGGNADLEYKRLLGARSSVLRYQQASLARFAKRFTGAEAMKAKAHLDAVSSALNDLGNQALLSGCSVAAPPTATDFPAMAKAQQDLIVLALQCGITRVATWQLTDAGGANVDLPWLGISGKSLHDVAHGTTPAFVAAKAKVDTYFMQQMAGLLNGLQSAADPDGGTLLDHAVVLWANNMQDGRTHDPQKLPWLLATGSRAAFATGRCAASAGQPLTAVLASLCNAFGAKGHPFGAPLTDS